MSSVEERMWGNGMLPVSFKCPVEDCDGHVEGEVEPSGYDPSAEHESDAIGHAQTILVCDECETEFTLNVMNYGAGIEVSVLEFPRVDVQYNDDNDSRGYEDFLAGYEPDNPYAYYLIAKAELENVLLAGTQPHIALPFYRMLFLGHVSALEAYLSDRLLLAIQNDDKALVDLGDAIDAKQKFTLRQIGANPRFVHDTVKKALQDRSVHPVDVGNRYFKAVFQQSMFADKEIESYFDAKIEIRHDCVHRNGVTKDGAPHHFDAEVVREFSIKVSMLVGHIERIHNDYLANGVAKLLK